MRYVWDVKLVLVKDDDREGGRKAQEDQQHDKNCRSYNRVDPERGRGTPNNVKA